MIFEEFEQWLDQNQMKQHADALRQYLELLCEWSEKMNLTAIKDPEEILEKHFIDSILPLTQTEISGSAADVGTGAGFPGLVWKIVKPELQVTLIEPTEKRCRFLREVIQNLKLKDIDVVNMRAEDYAKDHRETFDIVTARAVANLNVLCELCIPLIRIGGKFIAMKGAQALEEKNAAQKAAETLGARFAEARSASLPKGDTRTSLIYIKDKATPAKYPRNYGQIKKKPL
ncbi:MAG: 16S rRNA (guanine(527)-N(7))-methyltransferase RsmG [Solobacterium sp.]|nr:16S rRNA (guanine(527)-N(7))-methyltransferase RsmG [Solobacterium sp.]